MLEILIYKFVKEIELLLIENIKICSLLNQQFLISSSVINYKNKWIMYDLSRKRLEN